MQDFQQRKKIRKLMYSRNVVILLGFVTLFLIKGVVGVIQKDMDTRKNAELASVELHVAQVRSEELSKHIALLNTQAGVESEIRQKFSVSKEGEEVAVIVDLPEASTSNIQTPLGLWGTIAQWFESIF